MSTIEKYVVINTNDEIVSTHRDYLIASKKAGYKFAYFQVGQYDSGDVFAETDLTKGNRVPGIWQWLENNKIDEYCVELMVMWLEKRVISDREPVDRSEMSIDAFTKRLTDYGLTVDEFIRKYTQRGNQLKAERDEVSLKNAEQIALQEANLLAATEHHAGACFSLPAIAGKMGDSIYFTVQVPMPQFVRLFRFNESDVPIELRAQRELKEKHAESISQYLQSRPSDYTLPAVTASVSDAMQFEPAPGFTNVGTVRIPIDAQVILNDGQHRRRGIELALENGLPIKDQHITVVIFYDKGLERSQQIFADINNNASKPQKALSILFDRRNAFNRNLIHAIKSAGLDKVVEFEKASPGAKSRKLWGVTALKKATQTLSGLTDEKFEKLDPPVMSAYAELFTAWFKSLVQHAPSLSGLVNADPATVIEARKETIVTHAAYLHAAAMASKELCEEFKQSIADYEHAVLELPEESHLALLKVPQFDELSKLALLDTSKSNPKWMNRLIKPDHTMNITTSGIKLGAYVMLTAMDMQIPEAIEVHNNEMLN
ncbi:DNA sulfur modification protein DndB [Pseudoalteromonas luteoviolacea]|uniref:DNA sulfur modification protein DndB n=1 Tax=Pseudoalteromonas luteoviolacea TaxID=43657 RepID=UPI001B38BD41|nr:DNA sulfur modification protein DndB [Pseudoalteromonas luteoviolacea]MBQ4839803.1 DNA sulfur modification protein DndB [Pseudoalteromonas luteoviolacea]